MTYQLQYLNSWEEWKDLPGEIVDREELAWSQLTVWERSCPHDQFRWVRTVIPDE